MGRKVPFAAYEIDGSNGSENERLRVKREGVGRFKYNYQGSRSVEEDIVSRIAEAPKLYSIESKEYGLKGPRLKN